MKKLIQAMAILTLSLVLFLLVPKAEASTIVNTTNTYTYDEMVADIQLLKQTYPDIISYQSIGKSEFNRNIYGVKLGKGKETILINGSHHAREWISTMIVMEMIESYAKSYQSNTLVGSYYGKDLLDEISISFVPMVNPDGVTLQQQGLKAFPTSHHSKLVHMNDGKKEFTRWKANAMGIDLNRQYPANWYNSSEISRPYYHGYKGTRPFQAKEVITLRDYTLKIKPTISVSYHSSGRVLYWYFHNKKINYARDYRLAKIFSETTNYKLAKPDKNSTGKGHTDWFIQQFGLPAFTPELSYAVGERHVPVSIFPEEWKRNESIGLWLLAEGYDIKFPNKKITPFNERVALRDNIFVYQKPSFLSREKSTLAAQEIQAFANYQNWYQIKTVTGDKWVYLPYELETFPDRIYLDVPPNHWAFSSTKNNKERGWMFGNSPSHFGVNTPLTREQLAVILVRILKLPIVKNQLPSFQDVPNTHKLYDYIETVKEHQLINGTQPQTFGIGETITREQMAVIFARSLKRSPISNDPKPFSDINETHWAYHEILLMKELGIFKGVDGNFKPKDKLTRGQLSNVLEMMDNWW